MKRYEDDLDKDMKWHRKKPKEYLKVVIAGIILLTAIFFLVKMLSPKREEAVIGTEIHTQTGNQIADLQMQNTETVEDAGNRAEEMTEDSEIEAPVELLTAGTVEQTTEQTRGIDVAKYQGIIDWSAVASEGIDFAMTALFVVIFVEQWMDKKNRAPEIIGVLAAMICLQIFGADSFVLPSMIMIVLTLFIGRTKLEGQVNEICQSQ